MQLQIPYVDRFETITIPERNLLFDIAPCDYPPAADFDSAIITALNAPIGTPALAQQLVPGMKVVIISDDNTRPTPTRRIIPLLLNHLNACGIPDRDVTILIASGTHRAMNAAEIEEKFGAEVMDRVSILPHRYKDPSELVEAGQTVSGARIFVNRHAVQADFRIAVGNIIPHHPAGWSGGAKAVLPGIGGEETVAQMHLRGSRNPALGVIDSAMRREMESVADQIHLNFILNVVLNREGALVAAFAGHFQKAHRAGVELAKKVYGVTIPDRADLVISSTSPIDFDFFQGDKGITAAEPATCLGGEIVCVSGCREGVSPAHPELAEYVGKMTNTQIWELVENRRVPDPLTAAEAIVINDIRDRMNITMMTDGLTAQTCAAMGLGNVLPGELNAYLQHRIQQSPDIRIGVIRQSAEIVPIVAS
jgi:nickel-dependent lactate racemase